MGQKRLKLSCGLTEFPIKILDLADSLEILDLSNNRLSSLPDAFEQLQNLKIAFFTNNEFEAFPEVLARCPKLSMVSFKGNKLKTISERALAPSIRWLILTNNQLKVLPAAIGQLSTLQKLMLAGNQLQSLPEALAHCQNLELIRLSANRLPTLPDWLLTLPRLAWLAYAGNPGCDALASVAGSRSLRSLPIINAAEIQLGDSLGQGASGVIYQGWWTAAQKPGGMPTTAIEPQQVAIKLFKGEITSDGLPLDEMRACVAAGAHPHLVQVVGKLSHSSEGKAGLVFSFIPPDYKNLGNPPDFDTCTRDTYPAETAFTLPMILHIARGVASAVAQLHANGIIHGDLYAHNILVNDVGHSLLGDFGAAFFYDPIDPVLGPALARLEVRAFGCLLEDLLDRYSLTDGEEPADVSLTALRRLQQECLHPVPTMRPLFSTINERLASV